MNRLPFLAVVLAPAFTGFSLLLGGCSSECFEVGCDSEVDGSGKLDIDDGAALAGSTARLCRNDDCDTATLEQVVVPAYGPTPPPTYRCKFAEGVPHSCIVAPAVEGTGYVVTFAYVLLEDDPDVADGDRYSYDIAAPVEGDAPLITIDGEAHYTESHPNGEACPPTCENAHVGS